MLTITHLSDKTQDSFFALFENYYKELGCDDDVPQLLKESVMPDLLAGLINIDILKEGEDYAGFVIYQIDDINNDWNLKEGWGDVREIYVLPPLRRQGFGKFLLYTAEMRLKDAGAEKSYALPHPYSEKFFEACGYKKTQDYCDELDCFIFEKQNLNNCDCKG